MRTKPILYVDMDGVLADFNAAILKIDPTVVFSEDAPDMDRVDEIVIANPNFFLDLPLISGGVESVMRLSKYFEIYFLSAPHWLSPQSLTDKRIWLETHFGEFSRKRLILSHQKDLCIGHFLVDDRTANGAGKFTGMHLLFGSEKFPNWEVIEKYLITWATIDE